jgi:integrase
VDPEILEVLHGLKARAKSPFVVPSPRVPGRTATCHYYRCEPIFDRVTAWLKQHGVSARKPLHALRKEYGSLINAKYDLVTAKELLHHCSVAITAAHYVENRKRGTTGLGAVPVKRMDAPENEPEVANERVAQKRPSQSF